MIHLLVGENSYKREQDLARILGGEVPEVYDGDMLDASNLADIFSGQTLFAIKRIVVIRDISRNKSIWAGLDTWLPRLAGDTTLIMIETSIDKRTKTYKNLQKSAAITSCDFWQQNDARIAEAWVENTAKQQGIMISKPLVQDMVARAMRPSSIDERRIIIDQAQLATVLQQLKGIGDVSSESIDAIMAPSVNENVFSLLETAIQGNADKLDSMIANLKQTQDAHMVIALLASQVTNLTALVLASGVSLQKIASDIGAHPFALQNLQKVAACLSREQIERIVEKVADADARAKSGVDVWSALEVALYAIAHIKK